MNEFFATLISYSRLILPWIFLGILLAYFYDRYFNHHHTIRHLKKTPSFFQIVSAQVLGMISPLSILSFFPVASELVADGVSSGLLLSFLIAERVYDLQSFFIIGSLLGQKFAWLSAVNILVSLVVTAAFLKHQAVHFVAIKLGKKEHFWLRQGKLLALAIMGIVVGAAIKAFIPGQAIAAWAGQTVGGLLLSLLVGFGMFLGPVVNNYPVAKTFFDLGMAPIGVLAFITVSPLLNVVILSMFSGAVGYKVIWKAMGLYTLTALLLLIPAVMWL